MKRGFSFTASPTRSCWRPGTRSEEVSYGDVLFAALEYYAPRVRKDADPRLWPVVRTWTDRVDNWCHSDLLRLVLAHLRGTRTLSFRSYARGTGPDELWLRRISLASLIHYSGKHAVFLPPDVVLPLSRTAWMTIATTSRRL